MRLYDIVIAELDLENYDRIVKRSKVMQLVVSTVQYAYASHLLGL